MSEPLLMVDDLSIAYASEEGALQALRHATLEARAGEAIGIVGESGCGKSTLASALITLLARNARVTSGGVRFGGLWLQQPPCGATTAGQQHYRGQHEQQQLLFRLRPGFID